ESPDQANRRLLRDHGSGAVRNVPTSLADPPWRHRKKYRVAGLSGSTRALAVKSLAADASAVRVIFVTNRESLDTSAVSTTSRSARVHSNTDVGVTSPLPTP